MKEDQIKAYFAFDDADLLANRKGELSEKQSKRVKDADWFAERFIFTLFFVFLISGIFVAILAIYTRNNIGLWIGTAILLSLAAWLFRGIHTDVDDAVQKVQGEVNFVKVESKTGPATDPASKRMTVSSYEMCVGSEAFSNINPALIEFMDGQIYAVYFTKTSKKILSVEKYQIEHSPHCSQGKSHDKNSRS